MDAKLIGLAGHAGSGKSTAAEVFLENGWVRVKFADVLKNMLRSLYATMAMPHEEIERRIEGDLKENHCPILTTSPRLAMQTLGQEWGREQINVDLWIHLWETRVCKEMREFGCNVVVDDVRYPNEVAAIHQLGGKVIQVARPMSMVVSSRHASEKFDFKPDGLIMNTGTKDELIEKVGEFL